MAAPLNGAQGLIQLMPQTTAQLGVSARIRLPFRGIASSAGRSEEHTSELQSRLHLVCRLLLEKKKKKTDAQNILLSFRLPVPHHHNPSLLHVHDHQLYSRHLRLHDIASEHRSACNDPSRSSS